MAAIAALHGVADARTYLHADDLELAWINNVTTRIAARETERQNTRDRWLVENLAKALGAKGLKWKGKRHA